MRSFPAHELAKNDAHTVDQSFYDLRALNGVAGLPGTLLGQVTRRYKRGGDSRKPWVAYVATTDSMGAESVKLVGRRRTRNEAIIAALIAWNHEQDEAQAHEIAKFMEAGIAQAEKQAQLQRDFNPAHRLVAAQYSDRPLSVSTRKLKQELSTHRGELRNRLCGLMPVEGAYVRHNAYMIRILELELERREAMA